jgi:hypothetical protein
VWKLHWPYQGDFMTERDSNEVTVYENPDPETIVDLQAQTRMDIAVIAFNRDAKIPLLLDADSGSVSVADLSINWSDKYIDANIYDAEHHEEALTSEEIKELHKELEDNEG